MGILRIDKKEFEGLVSMGLTTEEICDYFMVRLNGLNDWIKKTYDTQYPYKVIKRIRVQAKANFLTSQHILSAKNPTMSIWVGKNYYDQNDSNKVGEETDVEDNNDILESIFKGNK